MGNAFDLIITGNVITLSGRTPIAAAVAVNDGVIAAVGDVAQLRQNASSTTR